MDDQTNVYANAGGSVLVLNGSGVPLQTNSVCPLPGRAVRDSAGNYYFGGSFDGTQNFGGITLVGGWTNNNGHYSPGWPSCYVAKYASNGALQWVISFGPQANNNQLTDLILDPSGGLYAGFTSSGRGNWVTHLSNAGTWDWDWTQPNSQYAPPVSVKLGGVTGANCCALTVMNFSYLVMNRLDRSGGATGLGMYPLQSRNQQASLTETYSEPVIDDLGNAWQVGRCFDPNNQSCTAQWLRKCSTGTDLWDHEITPDAQALLARDIQSNLYLTGPNGMLAKYTGNGDLVWSNNFGRTCISLVTDGSGNRFVSFDDGSVARVQSDGTPQAPAISSAPTNQTAFAGDNLTLSVTANGTGPLFYQWRLNGTDLPGETRNDLAFTPLTPANGGLYSVVVTNSVNSITSTPALLKVKSVELYKGSEMLSGGSYVFGSPPTLTIRSALNGARYYTLDGSTPSQASTLYTGPFQLEHNATVRAIGYNADASQSEEADPVSATVFSQHTLSVTLSGSGTVGLNPPGGTYNNTNIVTATAVPAPGWAFLFWLDDASGSSPSVELSMEYDRSIVAVFGTNAPSGISAPGLAWSTNLAARLFGLDDQTNVYANAGGTVFVLNSNGAPLQTNSICPLTGRAARDSAGNYYFGGSFDGTQNFGGITLVGGWTNNNGHYSPGWPSCYVAKYASNGALQWVTSFGPQASNNQLTDLILDPSGGLYAGFTSSGGGNWVTHLSNAGAWDWDWTQPNSQYAPPVSVKLGGVTGSNCCALTVMNFSYLVVVRLDRSGNATALGQYPLQSQGPQVSEAETYSKPVVDDQGNAFQAGRCFDPVNPCNAQWLRKCDAETDLWVREITPEAQWLLARDSQSNIYAAGTNGMLAQYSSGGDLVWSNNFGRACLSMVTDGSGNRFVSFNDGSVARLGAEGASQTSFAIAPGTPSTGVQLKLTSQIQQVWQIEVSTNLTSWKVLGTVTNTSGSLQFSDPSTRTARTRFYRATPVP